MQIYTDEINLQNLFRLNINNIFMGLIYFGLQMKNLTQW